MPLRPRVLLSSLLCATALSLISACGGDVSRVEPYEPKRLYSLGDEHSLLTEAGKKYSINDPDSCSARPIWVQALADHFGFVSAVCNEGQGAPVTAFSQATLGAKVSDVATQAAQLPASLEATDLLTLWVGMHDVIALFEAGGTQAEQVRQAEAAGIALAAQVDALVGRGGRLLLVTIPDLSLTPYAQGKDKDRLALLSERFNTKLRTSITATGERVGLVLADSLTEAAALRPGNYGLSRVDQAACSVALPDCSSDTLVTDATANGWMWADDRHLGSALHSRIGNLAIDRALTNPF